MTTPQKTAREVIAFHLRGTCEEFGKAGAETEWADDIIKEIDAAGFVIVPKEPTPSMLRAAVDDMICGISCNLTGEAAETAAGGVYRAMIAKAQEQ